MVGVLYIMPTIYDVLFILKTHELIFLFMLSCNKEIYLQSVCCSLLMFMLNRSKAESEKSLVYISKEALRHFSLSPLEMSACTFAVLK